MAKINFKYQMQKYNTSYAFSTPNFREALRYFVKEMRRVHFVTAHDNLYKKYGTSTGTEVEMFCQLVSITCRPSCGRLFLAEGYEKRLP